MNLLPSDAVSCKILPNVCVVALYTLIAYYVDFLFYILLNSSNTGIEDFGQNPIKVRMLQRRMCRMQLYVFLFYASAHIAILK